jgi:hypothetical protein
MSSMFEQVEWGVVWNGAAIAAIGVAWVCRCVAWVCGVGVWRVCV